MDALYLLALAVGLGLLGFVEPCSIGANMVFLGHLREKGRGARLRETTKFALVRSAVLGFFGLGIAFLGSSVFAAQKGFWLPARPLFSEPSKSRSSRVCPERLGMAAGSTKRNPLTGSAACRNAPATPWSTPPQRANLLGPTGEVRGCAAWTVHVARRAARDRRSILPRLQSAVVRRASGRRRGRSR